MGWRAHHTAAAALFAVALGTTTVLAATAPPPLPDEPVHEFDVDVVILYGGQLTGPDRPRDVVTGCGPVGLCLPSPAPAPQGDVVVMCDVGEDCTSTSGPPATPLVLRRHTVVTVPNDGATLKYRWSGVRTFDVTAPGPILLLLDTNGDTTVTIGDDTPLPYPAGRHELLIEPTTSPLHITVDGNAHGFTVQLFDADT